MAKKTRTAARTPLTDEQREQRRQAERELLTSAVAQLKTSEGWLRWLKVRKSFRAYSMNNQLLIALQAPNATRVAGFQAWLKLGRCVKKGEKAIKIFAPVPPSKKMLEVWKAAGADPKKRPRPRFKLTSVFDLAQVAPLPEPATVVELDSPFDVALEGEDLAELLFDDGPFQTLADELGLTLTFQARDGGGACGGYFAPADKQIVVYADTTANAQAAIAAHEFAHALVRLDRHDDDPRLDYAREELVVESVAFSVMSALGIDAEASSVAYLACWSQAAPIETIEQHAKLIDRLAKRLELQLLGDPRATATAAAAAPPAGLPDAKAPAARVAVPA